jgi:hypothetical protein
LHEIDFLCIGLSFSCKCKYQANGEQIDFFHRRVILGVDWNFVDSAK